MFLGLCGAGYFYLKARITESVVEKELHRLVSAISTDLEVDTTSVQINYGVNLEINLNGLSIFHKKSKISFFKSDKTKIFLPIINILKGSGDIKITFVNSLLNDFESGVHGHWKGLGIKNGKTELSSFLSGATYKLTFNKIIARLGTDKFEKKFILNKFVLNNLNFLTTSAFELEGGTSFEIENNHLNLNLRGVGEVELGELFSKGTFKGKVQGHLSDISWAGNGGYSGQFQSSFLAEKTGLVKFKNKIKLSQVGSFEFDTSVDTLKTEITNIDFLIDQTFLASIKNKIFDSIRLSKIRIKGNSELAQNGLFTPNLSIEGKVDILETELTNKITWGDLKRRGFSLSGGINRKKIFEINLSGHDEKIGDVDFKTVIPIRKEYEEKSKVYLKIVNGTISEEVLNSYQYFFESVFSGVNDDEAQWVWDLFFSSLNMNNEKIVVKGVLERNGVLFKGYDLFMSRGDGEVKGNFEVKLPSNRYIWTGNIDFNQMELRDLFFKWPLKAGVLTGSARGKGVIEGERIIVSSGRLITDIKSGEFRHGGGPFFKKLGIDNGGDLYSLLGEKTLNGVMDKIFIKLLKKKNGSIHLQKLILDPPGKRKLEIRGTLDKKSGPFVRGRFYTKDGKRKDFQWSKGGVK